MEGEINKNSAAEERMDIRLWKREKEEEEMEGGGARGGGQEKQQLIKVDTRGPRGKSTNNIGHKH